jgi:YVTN family beta-propeller protein
MYRALFAAFLAISVAIPAEGAGRLFVVSKAKKTLQVFNPDTGTMEFEVPGPGEPHEVVVSSDGRFAYLGDAGGFKNTLCVVDLDKRAIVEEVQMKPHMRPHGMALTGDGKKLYVTSAPTRAVIEFETAPLRMARTFRFFVDAVDNLRLSPDESLIFASSSFDGNIVVLDVKKGEYERAIISGSTPEGLGISPDGAEVWVANRVSQTIAVIDVATRRRVKEIPCIGNPMNVYFTPKGDQVIVTIAVADRLGVFDRAKRAELSRFEVGDFPVELAFGEDGGPAFVTCAVANDVAVVDIKAQKVLRRIPVGGDPEGIAYWNK